MPLAITNRSGKSYAIATNKTQYKTASSWPNAAGLASLSKYKGVTPAGFSTGLPDGRGGTPTA